VETTPFSYNTINDLTGAKLALAAMAISMTGHPFLQ